MPFCKHCETEKAETEFYFGSKAQCKKCKSAKQRGRKRVQKPVPSLSKKTHPVLTCSHCSQSFPNRHSKARQFCSLKCANESRQTRKLMDCCVCGREVERAERTKKAICGRECKRKYLSELKTYPVTRILRFVRTFKRLVKRYVKLVHCESDEFKWLRVIRAQRFTTSKEGWHRKVATCITAIHNRIPGTRKIKRGKPSNTWMQVQSRYRTKVRKQKSMEEDPWIRCIRNKVGNLKLRRRKYESIRKASACKG